MERSIKMSNYDNFGIRIVIGVSFGNVSGISIS